MIPILLHTHSEYSFYGMLLYHYYKNMHPMTVRYIGFQIHYLIIHYQIILSFVDMIPNKIGV